MYVTVHLYSNKNGELNRFLSKFYNTNLDIYESLRWEQKYNNPIELAEIIGVFLIIWMITLFICGFVLIKMFTFISMKKMVMRL